MNSIDPGKEQMGNFFTSWIPSKPLPRIALGLVIFLFLWKCIALILWWGPAPSVQAMSESLLLTASKNLYSEGWTANAGLTHIPSFAHDTPIQKLRDTGVYTHFLPGDVYYGTFLMHVLGTGKNFIQWARIFPLFHTLFAILFLASVVRRRLFPQSEWAVVFFVSSFFAIPVIYIWGLGLCGFSYTDAYALAALGLGLIWTDPRVTHETQGRKLRRWLLCICFILGWVSVYLWLASVFILCAAPWIGALLSREKVSFRVGMPLSMSLGLGVCFGFFLHFWQVASFLDSWTLAFQDQVATAASRGHSEKFDLIKTVGDYSDHARAFIRVNALHYLVSGLFLAWLQPELNNRRARLAFAIGLATLGSYAWVMVMTRSALIHFFMFPHIFLLLFATWLIVAVDLGVQSAVQRAAKRSG